MKRVAVYLDRIKVVDGPVFTKHVSKGLISLNGKGNNKDYTVDISSAILQPEEVINLMAASDIELTTLVKDEEGFYDFNQTIKTDKLIKIEVRQFLVEKVESLNKQSEVRGFVLADLVY